MRRAIFTAVTTVAVVVGTALPAAGTESGGSGVSSTLQGGAQGALLAFVVGAILGVAFIVISYGSSPFGSEQAHHEQAHDIREGLGDHNAPDPGTDPGVQDIATGSG